eukprot:808520-Rhodomonas_salina.1
MQTKQRSMLDRGAVALSDRWAKLRSRALMLQWRTHAKTKNRLTSTARKIIMRMIDTTRHRSLMLWHARTEEKRVLRSVGGRVVRRWLKIVVSRAFETWAGKITARASEEATALAEAEARARMVAELDSEAESKRREEVAAETLAQLEAMELEAAAVKGEMANQKRLFDAWKEEMSTDLEKLRAAKDDE